MFVYLRLCTSGTLNQFTDHVLYNDAVLFCAADSGKVKWADQIHYFKHVIPASHVFILVQVSVCNHPAKNQGACSIVYSLKISINFDSLL